MATHTSLLEQVDVAVETQLARDPANAELWREYIIRSHDKPLLFRVWLYQRGCELAPQDVELWTEYVKLVLEKSRGHPEQITYTVIDESTGQFPHEMALWQEVLPFAAANLLCNVTYTRRLFNRALQGLAFAHHHQVFTWFLDFAEQVGGATHQLVLRQYLQFVAAGGTGRMTVDDVLDLLDDHLQQQMVEDMLRRPSDYITSHLGLALSKRLIQLQFGRPGFEAAVLAAIGRYPDQIGPLVVTLADAEPARARHWFAWGLERTTTLELFCEIYNAYVSDEWRRYKQEPTPVRAHFIRHLVAQRASWAVDTRLRAHPYDLDGWIERIALATDDKTRLRGYADALTRINPLKVRFSSVNLAGFWQRYATIYADAGDTKTANVVYSKASQSKFAHGELSEIYVAWSNMWLDQGDDKRALKVLEEGMAVVPPKHVGPLVSHYLDVLELLVDSASDVDRVATGFARARTAKLVTARQCLDHAAFLREWKRPEQADSVYEHAITGFPHPQIRRQVWRAYLESAYGRVSDHRFADLVDRAVFGAELALPYIREFVQLRPTPQMLRRAIGVLKKQTSLDALNDKFALYQLLVTRIGDADELRETYDWIVADLELAPAELVDITRSYIGFEHGQGQAQRVRALYRHLTQQNAPLAPVMAPVWTEWEAYEVDHGDEALFKEMMRWKRRMEEDFADKQQLLEENKAMGFVKATAQPTKINPNQIEIDMD